MHAALLGTPVRALLLLGTLLALVAGQATVRFETYPFDRGCTGTPDRTVTASTYTTQSNLPCVVKRTARHEAASASRRLCRLQPHRHHSRARQSSITIAELMYCPYSAFGSYYFTFWCLK